MCVQVVLWGCIAVPVCCHCGVVVHHALQDTLELECWGVPGQTVHSATTKKVPRCVNPLFGDTLLAEVDPLQDAPMTQWMCARCATVHNTLSHTCQVCVNLALCMCLCCWCDVS